MVQPHEERFVEKHEKLNQLLKPLDVGIEAGVTVLKKLKVYDPIRNSLFHGAKKVLGYQLKNVHQLKVEGLENLPKKGGMILAVNHQSWLDAQILGVGFPQKVCFLAKSEFVDWPLLRHFIEFSDSIFIRRGGDEKGLEEAVLRLKKGDTVCIFPEGTIPGEEDIPRSAVEKDTGLLRGKTGAVRLALKAGVPIVPVGLSGTGKAFPPEAYPRMEILPPFPKPYPVKIKIGKPIHFNGLSGKELSREELRIETKKVMKAISSLIDHKENYIPLNVPMKELPKYNKVGVLLLHGFTSHLKTVEGLKPYLEKHHLKFSMPMLRGHGTRFQDLEGVTYHDWYADAERALLKLAKTVDKVVVVGLSMGGLVALELGMKHPDKVAAVVTVAAALKFADPLSGLTKVISKVVPYWPSPNAFNDKRLAKNNENYKWFPTSAFASLYEYSQKVEKELPKLKVPILILHSKKDQIIAPKSANIIYEKISSDHRDIKWFRKSGHEMMQDLEAKEVFQTIIDYILQFTKKAEAKEKA
jgi:carboxylesterase